MEDLNKYGTDSMVSLDRCTENIIRSCLMTEGDILLIADKAHLELANNIREELLKDARNAKCIEIESEEAAENAFNESITFNSETLVFVEPSSFVRHQIFKWMDFKGGAPKILGLENDSYVSVMPIDSTKRVYSSFTESDKMARNEILKELNDDREYRITSCEGTDLTFRSRKWLEEGYEILTAPYEDSVNGKIAVDGALFFRRISEIVDIYITNGKIIKVEQRGDNKKLSQEYIEMTEADFEKDRNRQLAEIGIGYNTNAEISGCFMESEMAYGTCHFCFGNNKCYGGNNESSFHGGSVLIKNPRFEEVGSDDEVHELILKMHWFKSDDETKEAQDKLVDIMTEDTLHIMIPFFKYDKGCWGNMAEVIQRCSVRMDVVKNEKLLVDMFEWLQDLNWPGAETIVEILVKLDRELVIKHIERITETNEQDSDWLYFLAFYLVERLNIKEEEFKNRENHRILMKTL